MNLNESMAVVEAIMFAHGDPITPEKLSEASGIDLETTVKLIDQLERKYNVQEILGVPNMFKKMYEADNFINEGLKNLNFVSCGGDIVSEHFIEEFNKALHDNGSNATLCRGWGLTEMCAIGTTNSWIYSKPNSVGVPVESVEVQILDEDGNELDYGVLGEITLRGEMMMNG